MELKDKIFFHQRIVIETTSNNPKNSYQVQHAGNKSLSNFSTYMISKLIVYSFFRRKHVKRKHAIKKYELIKSTQLAVF